jgi:Concanavalin A-like lectin/glucanases superfamily/Secretion system C-terminal sorting domain
MKFFFTIILFLLILTLNLSAQTLVAYYPFNGNANDATTNGNNGTVNGATLTTDRFGNANSAYLFNGINNDIIVPDAPDLRPSGAYTISAWVEPMGFYSGSCQGNSIVNKGNYLSQDAYLLGYGDNILDGGNCAGFEPNLETFFLSYDQGGAEQYAYSPDIVQLNKWYMVTGVFDGTNVKTYVNGHLQGSMPAINVSGTPNTDNLYIGGYVNSGSPYWLNGKIDDISIYSGALSDSTIFNTYIQDIKRPGSGNALLFDNSKSQYIDVGSGWVPESSFTFETWVKRTSTAVTDAQVQLFIGSFNDNGWGVGIQQAGGTNRINLTQIGTSNVLSASAITDTFWHHVAVTFDANASQAVFYIDGIADPPVGYSPNFNSGHSDYRLGGRNPAGNGNQLNFLNGKMDETRIWDTVLTQTEIRDWMCKKVTASHPAFKNLVGYYKLDEGTDTIAYSTGGHPGILNNSPTWITSGASLGDASIYNYSATPSATLTHPDGESLSATATAGLPTGIQVYRVDSAPNDTIGATGIGANDRYFGVFVVGGTLPQYTAVYNYNGNPYVTDKATLHLLERANNAAIPWADAGATNNTTAGTLTVTGQHTEYILSSAPFALPVTLLNLNAKYISANDNLISWQTASEQNNKGFQVQRSSDGRNFVTIGFVPGAINSSKLLDYSFNDNDGLIGTTFYRLEQIDEDGLGTFSAIVYLDITHQSKISFVPNPVLNNITIVSSVNLKEVDLVGLTGQVIKRWSNVMQNEKLDVSNVLKGTYLIKFINDNLIQTQKLIKE